MNRFLHIVAILSLFASTSARADEETVRMIGGVALGLIGLAVDANAEKQPEQNDVQKVTTSSKPKLEYSQDVADVQSKLKQTGLYNGAVDGLKGQNTIDAINEWETQYSVESGDGRVNAMMSPDELMLLDKQIAEQNNASPPQQTEASVSNAPVEIPTTNKIKDIEELAALNHIHSVCSNYRDIGHSYSFAVRDDFDSIYDKVSKLFKKRIEKQAKCLGINDVELRQRRADKAYEESDDGKTITLGIAGAMGGVNSLDSASEYCNMSSGAVLISSRKLEKEVFNKETCEYE